MLRLGLVGAGAFGAFCLDAFAGVDDVIIGAVADIDTDRASALATQYDASAYTDLDTLLADERIDIVALNTPPYLHYAQGMQIIEAGKHLFCEKPLALTVEQGESMIQNAEDKGILLTVDYVMRHNPCWHTAVNVARSGVLGALRHADLANHAAGLDLPDTHWFWDRAKSGGIWIEHGVHFFDAFAWVTGESGQITAAQQFTRRDGAVDRVACLATFGATAAHFYHAFDQSGSTEQTTVRLTFERGYITLSEWVPTRIDIDTPLDNERLTPYIDHGLSMVSHDDRFSAIVPEGKSFVYTQAIQRGIHNLANAIQQGSPLAVTAEDALASLQLASAARKVTEGFQR